jgi:ankyrin repeat protein
MCKAAARGDLKSLRKLVVEQGANVDTCDYDKRSALHLAASEGHKEVVKFLLAYKASVDVQDRWGGTPLNDAYREGHVAVMKMLLNSGATYGNLNEALGPHALAENMCQAAAWGDIDMIRNLIKKGASVLACDYDHRSALHLAAAEGRATVVRYLIDHKADVTVKDRFGCDPLRDAIRGGHAEIQQMIFDAGTRDRPLDEQAAAAVQEAYMNQPLQVCAKLGCSSSNIFIDESI